MVRDMLSSSDLETISSCVQATVTYLGSVVMMTGENGDEIGFGEK